MSLPQVCPKAAPAGMGDAAPTGTAPVTAHQNTSVFFVNMRSLHCPAAWAPSVQMVDPAWSTEAGICVCVTQITSTVTT
ncbi:hypothetical protein FKM82_030048, partial [Ascaphus truei]